MVPDERQPAPELSHAGPSCRSGTASRASPLTALARTQGLLLERPGAASLSVFVRVGVEGLPLTEGEHFVLADRPDEFAHAVVALLRDPERRRALTLAGRKLVEERYSWVQVARQFETICQQVVAH